MTYQMTCDCGETVAVEASSRSDAVNKMKGIMTEEVIRTHIERKHPGQPVPTMEQAHSMIEKNLAQAC